MHSSEITRLKAIEIRAALSRGKLTPRDIAEAYRSRIQHRESQIGAFAHLDWNTVDKQIKALPAGQVADPDKVAALKDEHGTTWFFKMTGPAAAVAKAKPGLVQLLGSLRHG